LATDRAAEVQARTTRSTGGSKTVTDETRLKNVELRFDSLQHQLAELQARFEALLLKLEEKN
jgi:hypothetical protein